jgi:diguanylate cyclase (GGDEF)-like protein/PAS domain S-box-containing protein
MHEDVVEGILRDILDAIPDGIFVTDADRRIVYWSDGAGRITGYSAEDVVGTRCDRILVHEDPEGRRLCDTDGCFLQRTIVKGDSVEIRESYIKHEDGERLGVFVKTRPLKVDGETFAVQIFGELSSQEGRAAAQSVQDVADLAVTDTLTGLFNRLYLDAVLEQQYALFRRVGLHFAVTVIDIDGSTDTNADYGASTGDEAIRFVASILAHNTRKMDTLARFGDDEFIIVSAVRRAEGAEEIGKRVLRLVRGSEFISSREEVIALRVSVGGAVIHSEDRTETDIITRAHDALDEVRRAGGDGFRFSV